MSELLDAFDDEGLLDPETRTFLVEALSNSEPDEWRDILEPFVRPEAALPVLRSVPGVLQRSLKALATSGCAGGASGPPPSVSSIAFLDSLLKIMELSGLHTAARCAQICHGASVVASETTFWLRLDQLMCASWSLPLPVAEHGPWRQQFFRTLRPRYDGVYVGECGFNRWVPVGHHADMRKNAAALSSHGGRGGHYEWVTYRRYVRLMPPHWALVLQDSCPRAAAEQVLIIGVDPETHSNPGKSEYVISDVDTNVGEAGVLRKRICLGHFTFTPSTSNVEVKYTAGDGEFRLAFDLSHRGPRGFADRLEWSLYTRTDANSEVLEYNLGRLPDWKGGGLINEGKDHFPCMDLRPSASLEHLLA